MRRSHRALVASGKLLERTLRLVGHVSLPEVPAAVDHSWRLLWGWGRDEPSEVNSAIVQS